jgi:hypothetical protein
MGLVVNNNSPTEKSKIGYK